MADKAFAFIPLELIYSSAHIGYGCICRKQLFFYNIFVVVLFQFRCRYCCHCCCWYFVSLSNPISNQKVRTVSVAVVSWIGCHRKKSHNHTAHTTALTKLNTNHFYNGTLLVMSNIAFIYVLHKIRENFNIYFILCWMVLCVWIGIEKSSSSHAVQHR